MATLARAIAGSIAGCGLCLMLGVGLVFASGEPGDGQSAFLPLALGLLGAVVGSIIGAAVRPRE